MFGVPLFRETTILTEDQAHASDPTGSHNLRSKNTRNYGCPCMKYHTLRRIISGIIIEIIITIILIIIIVIIAIVQMVLILITFISVVIMLL